MLRSPRLTLAGVNLLILALAVAMLVSAAPQGAVDPRLLDAPLSAPGEWFDSQRAIGTDRTAYARAIEQAAAAETLDVEWNLLGPRNIGGRVNDVVVDPTAEDTIFIAAASGGVWKSTDAGQTFERAWPDDATQSIGALAIGSDGVLYAGTGEANPGGGSIVYGGTGVYRSADGGESWEHVGLPTSGAIGRIAVDPTNPQRVYVAASGNLFLPAGQRGLYRSDNGGSTWKPVLRGENNTTGAVDIAIDPSNPDTLLAALWDHHRTPEGRFYAGPGSALMRSTDGGHTWTELAEITMDPAEETGRIGVAFSPADPNRAYAIIANKLDGTFGALFRSDDNGQTWTTIDGSAGMAGLSSVGSNQSSFGWWFGRIFTDPDEKDRLFVTGVELMASDDGGDTFTQMGQTLAGVVTGEHHVNVHADQHGMAWDPNVDGRVYAANDGGIYRSDNDGDVGTWTGGLQQGWTQHYSVDVSEQSTDYVITGLQDNMCQRSFPVDDGAVTQHAWTKVGICGDGLQTLIHPENPAITFACSQYGGCARQVGGVGSLGGLDPTFNKPGNQRWGWFSPLEFQPGNPDVMYWGSNFVNRSTDNGRTWSKMSPFDLSDPEEELEQIDPHSGYRLRGVVTAIGVTADPAVLYAGTDNGRLWVTRDTGASWEELTDNLGTGAKQWITRVTVDPDDVNTVYVSFSGYRAGNDAPHVVRSTDGGVTWSDLTGNLPIGPVNDVIVVDDGLVAATDVGVFLSQAGDGEWVRVGTNLPTVPVIDVRWHEATRTLTAATFGHGIQRVTLP